MHDPVGDERASELLRREAVAEAYTLARDARPGVEGEPERRRFRAVGRAYLAHVTSPLDEARHRLTAGEERPAAELELGLMSEDDPETRRSLYRMWEAHADRFGGWLEERAAAAHEAVEAVGAPDVAGYLAAEHPLDPEPTCQRFEAGAIAPLDDPVAHAMRERWLGADPRAIEPQAWDVPRLLALTDRPPQIPSTISGSLLRRLGSPLGADPDGRGPRLVPWSAPHPWTMEGLDAEREPVVLPGAAAGPVALARTLGVWGRAVRASFLRRERGPVAVALGDPAFAVAAEVPFRRLVLSEPFWDELGLGGRVAEGLQRDLALNEALAPRRAWTYLSLALKPADGAQADEALARASGLPPTVADRLGARGRDPYGAAMLRGIVLGLLLEERLLTRHGRRWFETMAARRTLEDGWDAEVGETAESLADNMDLGTIEPTPILDRCQPVG